MSTKKYRLKKDLPNVKAGAILEWNSTETWNGGPYKGGRYGIWPMPSDKSCDIIFTPEDVESNSEWFEEIKEPERIEVKMIDIHRHAYLGVHTGWYEFVVSKPFSSEKLPLIKEAIELVLNEPPVLSSGFYYECLKYIPETHRQWFIDKISKMILEAENKAFNAALIGRSITISKPQFPTFSDYKNSQSCNTTE